MSAIKDISREGVPRKPAADNLIKTQSARFVKMTFDKFLLPESFFVNCDDIIISYQFKRIFPGTAPLWDCPHSLGNY